MPGGFFERVFALMICDACKAPLAGGQGHHLHLSGVEGVALMVPLFCPGSKRKPYKLKGCQPKLPTADNPAQTHQLRISGLEGAALMVQWRCPGGK